MVDRERDSIIGETACDGKKIKNKLGIRKERDSNVLMVKKNSSHLFWSKRKKKKAWS